MVHRHLAQDAAIKLRHLLGVENIVEDPVAGDRAEPLFFQKPSRPLEGRIVDIVVRRHARARAAAGGFGERLDRFEGFCDRLFDQNVLIGA